MSQIRLEQLRDQLATQEVQGFLVPRCDEYQNEYVPAADERLAWLTDFTGSAGLAMVTGKAAALFVDGRYTLQAADQIGEQQISQQSLTPADIAAWAIATLGEGDKLGYDPKLHTEPGLKLLRESCAKGGIELVALDSNPIDAIWQDRPATPSGLAVPHPLQYTGEESTSKRQRIGAGLAENRAGALLLPNPEVCAWLFNFRGNDIPHLPVALSMGILYADGSAALYLHKSAADAALRDHLGEGVTLLHDKQALFAHAKERGVKAVQCDPLLSNLWSLQQIEAQGMSVVRAADPVVLTKACKNPVELDGARTAHIRDGVAVCEFLADLPQHIDGNTFGEMQAVHLLRAKREATDGFSDDSFDSISGYGPNGAHCHYRVSEESSLTMEPKGIYLIDSGGQYPDGTTDVTRTLAMGEVPASAKEHFTRVLKGHIALGTLRFPEGTNGEHIDAFARKSLWDAGLDYAHGTGHGVGSFLSVHEGPQRIGKAASGVALREGMILSNEPGFYLTGEYGIRIENLVFVKKSERFEGFLEFEDLTLVPIDLSLVEPSLLTEQETEWLNNYHALVRDTLTPLVSDKTRAWLEHSTRAI
ncbi:aminopeptidase P family protein [Biformimicrobium ophioploci]|uniref:Aminopeptidase P family protein n=1 Tax=Biformimicrobium ophioploci TaxID=3036711 RepID=A0ABQ6LYK4_9GAMM|nr:aminopeptidase P family protein [Microbulbifer sp. NKW57]GMG87136.1 aminopeptidase P family protein [Microbulbifer sp. NKW57]